MTQYFSVKVSFIDLQLDHRLAEKHSFFLQTYINQYPDEIIQFKDNQLSSTIFLNTPQIFEIELRSFERDLPVLGSISFEAGSLLARQESEFREWFQLSPSEDLKELRVPGPKILLDFFIDTIVPNKGNLKSLKSNNVTYHLPTQSSANRQSLGRWARQNSIGRDYSNPGNGAESERTKNQYSKLRISGNRDSYREKDTFVTDFYQKSYVSPKKSINIFHQSDHHHMGETTSHMTPQRDLTKTERFIEDQLVQLNKQLNSYQFKNERSKTIYNVVQKDLFELCDQFEKLRTHICYSCNKQYYPQFVDSIQEIQAQLKNLNLQAKSKLKCECMDPHCCNAEDSCIHQQEKKQETKHVDNRVVKNKKQVKLLKQEKPLDQEDEEEEEYEEQVEEDEDWEEKEKNFNTPKKISKQTASNKYNFVCNACDQNQTEEKGNLLDKVKDNYLGVCQKHGIHDKTVKQLVTENQILEFSLVNHREHMEFTQKKETQFKNEIKRLRARNLYLEADIKNLKHQLFDDESFFFEDKRKTFQVEEMRLVYDKISQILLQKKELETQVLRLTNHQEPTQESLSSRHMSLQEDELHDVDLRETELRKQKLAQMLNQN